MRWILAEFILILADISRWNLGSYANVIYDNEDYDLNSLGITEAPTTTPQPPPTRNESSSGKDDEKKPFSCDQQIILYILNQSLFLNTMGETIVVHEDEPGDCHPRYWAVYIRETNLLLVVVENSYVKYDSNCTIPPNTTPEPTTNSTTSKEPCHKLDLASLTRRRLEGCFTYHKEEKNITACGFGNISSVNLVVFIVCSILALIFTSWTL